MLTNKLEDFPGNQKVRHHSNIGFYYPKELVIQEEKEKYFSDKSLLGLKPQKPKSPSQNPLLFIQTNSTYDKIQKNFFLKWRQYF